MAERRMFAKSITGSDRFLELPASAQALYFHLGMQADDDGLVNSPRSVQRMMGAGAQDLRLLEEAGLILSFESGVVAIRHWKVNNRIQKDRYKPSLCAPERAQLQAGPSGIYERAPAQAQAPDTQGRETPDTQGRETLDTQERETLDTQGRETPDTQERGTLDTQEREGQSSQGKPREGEAGAASFVPPTLQEAASYCRERKNDVDPQRFVDFYASKGWMVGGSPMRDWKAALRRWEGGSRPGGVPQAAPAPPPRAAPAGFSASSIDAQMLEFLSRSGRAVPKV